MDDDARRLELSPSLRQLCHPDLDPLFWLPERRGAFSAWWGHVPFAHWVMRAARPRVMVELGTHNGVSYTAFCQAVLRCRLNTRCFAVDTWKGDPHASFYEEGVYEDFRAFHDQRYAAFSSLLRCTFDEALDRIEDGSIDLLHLDGLHTYDAVRHDFQSWLPKFSARGVALLHDINVYRDDFGVWRLWHELREQHPHFEFHHCYGLGVLALGREPPEAVAELCALNDREEGAALRSRVALIGDRWIAEARGHDLRADLTRQQQEHTAAAAAIEAAAAAARSEAEALARAANTERTRLQDALADAEKKLDQANADTARRKASIVELQTQKAAFAHELQTQKATFAEQRDRLERDAAALRVRVQQLEVIEQSTTWRATRVLRGAASRVPRPVRSALRRAVKAGYWVLTPHRMPARIRFLRNRGQGVLAPEPTSPSRIDLGTAAKSDALRWSWGEEPLPDPPTRSESVDIVVCVHNALEDVRQCLHSVLACTQPPYRLIIVDDGSAEETRDYLADFAATHDIILLRNESALGYTGAANCGLRTSDAPWVVLLNSDTVVTKPWLDAMWSHGWRDPNIGVIGPLSNTASWQSVPLLSEDGDWARNPLPTGMTPQDVADLTRDAALGARAIPFLNGFCYMIRREVIDRIGIFDEKNFANYGEENDYSIRARQAGYRLVVATDAYIFHNSSRSYSPERRRAHQDRANKALAARHDPTLHISPQVEYCQTSPVFTSLRARVGAALRRRELVETGRRQFAGRRVAFMLPVTEYGGGANVVLQEAKAMAAMGVKVTVLNLTAYQEALTKHAAANGRFLTFPDEAALRDHLAGLPVPYDAVVGTYYGSVYWLPKQRPPECAYGYYIQDFEPLFFSETDERYQHALLSYTAHKDLRLITKTAWNQRAVGDATGRVPTVIGCSVNVDLFAPAEKRAMAPIDRPLRIAAMLRPASAYRAPARTLAVFEEVLRRYPSRVTVHTFGTSDDQLAANCLARPWIANHGHLPPERVAALLGRSDIFVDFSDYQAMGLSLLEAMVSGCAVVGPVNGGATAFLQDGVNGLLADTTSIDDCVEKTARLVGDRDLRNNLQRRAIEDASTHVPEAAALNILNALFNSA